jgi:hypothetical protein
MNKKAIVKHNGTAYEFDIDTDIFDDIGLEACTRLVELLSKQPSMKLFEWIDVTVKGKKSYVYNTNKILINAGLYKKAEILRSAYIKELKNDLNKHPIKLLK